MKFIESFRALYFIALKLILVLLTCFSLSSLALKEHSFFLSSIYELIAAVKSSRVAVYFVLNVIIMVIFFGSFKPFHYSKDFCDDHQSCYYTPISDPEKDQATSFDHDPGGYHDHEDDDDDDDEDDSGNDSLFGAEEDCDDYEDDDDDDDDDGDSEKLSVRIEDFIAKNINRWREESKKELLP